MNLQETIETLISQGRKLEAAENTPRVIKDIQTDGRYLHVATSGALQKVDLPPGNRAHTVDSVEDLCEAAKRWNTKPVLWVSARHVVLITNDDDRRDRVTLPLHTSACFDRLVKLSTAPVLNQAELIRTLRVDLRKARGVAEILTAVRKVKFRSSAEGHSDIQHGNESLGKSIENEVTGAGAIPETLVVPVHVFRNPGEQEVIYEVGLDLEIDAANQKFILLPIPDEIENAVAQALESIHTHLSDVLEEATVFYGTP